MLRKLLEGRLVFTPTDDGTTVIFRGTGVLDPVLSGIVAGDGIPTANGSPRGHHAFVSTRPSSTGVTVPIPVIS
jgi:hypothetical protein